MSELDILIRVYLYRATMPGPPAFLARMQQRQSPGGGSGGRSASATAAEVRRGVPGGVPRYARPYPDPRLRGASMTQSGAPGGIGFLARQYNSVVSQQPGQPAASSSSPPSKPHPAPQQPSPLSPPKREVRNLAGLPPPPQVKRAVLLAPMPTKGSLSTHVGDIADFLQKSRDTIVVRRHAGASEVWCSDADRLLREAKNILALYDAERSTRIPLDAQNKALRQELAELNAARSQDKARRAQDQAEHEQEVAALKAQLLAKHEATVDAEGAANRLTGQVARLTAEVESKNSLLKDEKARSEMLRAERNTARESELEIQDLRVSKVECERLAARVAALESDNAILMAEKSQWLKQLEQENDQLQSLFEDARTAKDVMVRELNAIDKERHQLAQMRLDLSHQLQYAGVSGVDEAQKIREEAEQAAAAVLRDAETQAAKTKKEAAEKAAATAEGAVGGGRGELTTELFVKTSQASHKFYQLGRRLERRQDKMTVCFNAGLALLRHYTESGDGAAAAALGSDLVARAMQADDSLLDEASSCGVDHAEGGFYVEDDRSGDAKRFFDAFESKQAMQTAHMQQGKDQMRDMFVEAFNQVRAL